MFQLCMYVWSQPLPILKGNATAEAFYTCMLWISQLLMCSSSHTLMLSFEQLSTLC